MALCSIWRCFSIVFMLASIVLASHEDIAEWNQVFADTLRTVLANETTPPNWFTRLPGYDCYNSTKWPGDERITFECPASTTKPSATVPISVHRLRPADITVIGALGDSLTSANGAGACFFPEVAYMYRGKCYSTGGDDSFEKSPTLANILRKFNPNLKGFSLKTNWWTAPEAGMNVGIPGAVADDMPEQARAIVRRMHQDENIDVDRDWKLITLFIGGNDLCGWCRRQAYRSPENYVNFISEAIDIIKAGLPRTMVAVLGILKVTELGVLNSTRCDFYHRQFCSCAMDPEIIPDLLNIQKEYQVQTQEKIESGLWDTEDRDDFTVTLLPALHKANMPLLPDGSADASYFSPDCFHFSHKAHAGFGVALWNNLIEPVGQKVDDAFVYLPDGNIRCPQDFPYIYTNINSQEGFEIVQPPKSSAAQLFASLTTILAALIIRGVVY